jgi:hypothetical protein
VTANRPQRRQPGVNYAAEGPSTALTGRLTRPGVDASKGPDSFRHYGNPVLQWISNLRSAHNRAKLRCD